MRKGYGEFADIEILKDAIDRLGDSVERVFGNGAQGSGYLGYVDNAGYPLTVTTALIEIAAGLKAIAKAISGLSLHND